MAMTTGERDLAGNQVGEQKELELWAALAANAELLGKSPEKRVRLLHERARLWDELASISSPACGDAYRDAADKCRAESSTESRTESSQALSQYQSPHQY